MQKQKKAEVKIEKRWMTTKEVAHYTGYSEKYLRELRMTGKIRNRITPPPYFKSGSGAVRYEKKDIDAWMKREFQKIGDFEKDEVSI